MDNHSSRKDYLVYINNKKGIKSEFEGKGSQQPDDTRRSSWNEMATQLNMYDDDSDDSTDEYIDEEDMKLMIELIESKSLPKEPVIDLSSLTSQPPVRRSFLDSIPLPSSEIEDSRISFPHEKWTFDDYVNKYSTLNLPKQNSKTDLAVSFLDSCKIEEAACSSDNSNSPQKIISGSEIIEFDKTSQTNFEDALLQKNCSEEVVEEILGEIETNVNEDIKNEKMQKNESIVLEKNISAIIPFGDDSESKLFSSDSDSEINLIDIQTNLKYGDEEEDLLIIKDIEEVIEELLKEIETKMLEDFQKQSYNKTNNIESTQSNNFYDEEIENETTLTMNLEANEETSENNESILIPKNDLMETEKVLQTDLEDFLLLDESNSIIQNEETNLEILESLGNDSDCFRDEDKRNLEKIKTIPNDIDNIENEDYLLLSEEEMNSTSQVILFSSNSEDDDTISLPIDLEIEQLKYDLNSMEVIENNTECKEMKTDTILFNNTEEKQSESNHITKVKSCLLECIEENEEITSLSESSIALNKKLTYSEDTELIVLENLNQLTEPDEKYENCSEANSSFTSKYNNLKNEEDIDHRKNYFKQINLEEKQNSYSEHSNDCVTSTSDITTRIKYYSSEEDSNNNSDVINGLADSSLEDTESNSLTNSSLSTQTEEQSLEASFIVKNHTNIENKTYEKSNITSINILNCITNDKNGKIISLPCCIPLKNIKIKENRPKHKPQLKKKPKFEFFNNMKTILKNTKPKRKFQKDNDDIYRPNMKIKLSDLLTNRILRSSIIRSKEETESVNAVELENMSETNSNNLEQQQVQKIAEIPENSADTKHPPIPKKKIFKMFVKTKQTQTGVSYESFSEEEEFYKSIDLDSAKTCDNSTQTIIERENHTHCNTGKPEDEASKPEEDHFNQVSYSLENKEQSLVPSSSSCYDLKDDDLNLDQSKTFQTQNISEICNEVDIYSDDICNEDSCSDKLVIVEEPLEDNNSIESEDQRVLNENCKNHNIEYCNPEDESKINETENEDPKDLSGQNQNTNENEESLNDLDRNKNRESSKTNHKSMNISPVNNDEEFSRRTDEIGLSNNCFSEFHINEIEKHTNNEDAKSSELINLLPLYKRKMSFENGINEGSTEERLKTITYPIMWTSQLRKDSKSSAYQKNLTTQSAGSPVACCSSQRANLKLQELSEPTNSDGGNSSIISSERRQHQNIDNPILLHGIDNILRMNHCPEVEKLKPIINIPTKEPNQNKVPQPLQPPAKTSTPKRKYQRRTTPSAKKAKNDPPRNQLPLSLYNGNYPGPSTSSEFLHRTRENLQAKPFMMLPMRLPQETASNLRSFREANIEKRGLFEPNPTALLNFRNPFINDTHNRATPKLRAIFDQNTDSPESYFNNGNLASGSDFWKSNIWQGTNISKFFNPDGT